MARQHEFYTHGHSQPVVDAHAQRTVTNSAQFLVPDLTDGVELLDFGCGPGSITAGLAEHVGSQGRVVGVDSDAGVLAIAERDHPAPNVTYLQASVYTLPFPDESFDVAYGHQILQHLADPVAALVEVRRVLRPGGLVAVRDGDFGSMVHYPRYPALDRWLDVYQRVARRNGGEPDAGRRLHEWVSAAGFTDAIASVSSWHYTTPEQRGEWAKMWADRIRVPRFAEQVKALNDGTDVDELAAAWLEWAREPAGWFAFLHGEVLAVKPQIDR
jgi:ubiquinone/menaquinone biosynthesis C-methylase UbiE